MSTSQRGERPIRVLLVDDHAVVRKGLRALLDREPGIEVAGEAEDGQQAVRAADRLWPDVILMDLEMPGVGGIEATRQISASRPASRIVVLTSHAAEEDVFPGAEGRRPGLPAQALRAGGRPARHPPGAPRRDGAAPGDRPHGLAGAAPTGAAEAGADDRAAVRARAGGAAADRAGPEQPGDRRHAGGGRGDGAQPRQQHLERKLQLASRTQAALYALREGLASLDEADLSH